MTILLNHLGSNLSTDEATTTYGKLGSVDMYGIANTFTTEQADELYIGYTKDENGNLICSTWDGDFERDWEDGRGVWTLNTAGGDDYVQIRDDQNGYTVSKLGAGDDIIKIGNTLDSNLVEAQTDGDARSYIFTESGDDAVYVEYEVDGGRIFTGAGSDTVTINGEVDDGAVIDLGSGMTDYANGHEEAAEADTKEDVNTLIINGDLGEYKPYDFASVYGGAGQDIVTIQNEIQGKSIVSLGDNDDVVNVKYMENDSQIITARDNDTVNVELDLFGNSIINTAGEVVEAVAAVEAVEAIKETVTEFIGTLKDGTVLTREREVCVQEAVEAVAAVEGHTDDDVVTIGGSTLGHSLVEVGDGVNLIQIGDDVDYKSTISAGKDQDTLIVHDDIADFATVMLRDGENVAEIGSHIKNYASFSTGNDADILNVGWNITDFAEVALGDGDNKISVGNDIAGEASLTAGEGNDTLIVNDDIRLLADVNLGNGDNVITVADNIEDNASVIVGNGNDLLSVGYDIANHAEVLLGAGNDAVTVNGAVINCGLVDLSTGDDVFTTLGGLYNNAKVLGGEGFDTLVIGSDLANLDDCHRPYASASNFSGFESVTLAGDATLDISFKDLIGQEGDLFINGGENNIVDLGATAINNDCGIVSMWDIHCGKWEQTGSEVVDGVSYNVYQATSMYADNLSSVYVQSDIAVI